MLVELETDPSSQCRDDNTLRPARSSFSQKNNASSMPISHQKSNQEPRRRPESLTAVQVKRPSSASVGSHSGESDPPLGLFDLGTATAFANLALSRSPRGGWTAGIRPVRVGQIQRRGASESRPQHAEENRPPKIAATLSRDWPRSLSGNVALMSERFPCLSFAAFSSVATTDAHQQFVGDSEPRRA